MKNKNNTIQSRREFFKNLTKASLPILGATILAANPVIAKAAEKLSCDYTCKASCANDCYGHCKYGCKTTCTGTCSGSCRTTCHYSNK